MSLDPRENEFSTMAIIALIATLCNIFVLYAGFLNIITGLAALDEINKYKYKGKIVVILSMVVSSGLTIYHILAGLQLVPSYLH